MTKKKLEQKKRSVGREYIEALVLALILALIIRTFIIQAFKIPSGSMIPTFLRGDQILVNKFIYGVRIPFTDIKLFSIREPERGDIVVFEYPLERKVHYIKRLVGVPGDEIEIVNKELRVNGEVVEFENVQHEDPAIFPSSLNPRDNYGPITVPPHSYFMMGDNRDNSKDSRYWGFVDEAMVVGNAVIIYWSWDITTGGFIQRLTHIRWDRLGTILTNK
jgi:signal peptidase I